MLYPIIYHAYTYYIYCIHVINYKLAVANSYISIEFEIIYNYALCYDEFNNAHLPSIK